MAKQEAEWSNRLSVRFLKKHGYLKSGWRNGNITWSYGGAERSSIGFVVVIDGNEADNIRLQYTHTSSWTGEKESMDLRVALISTPCRYGGKRYWFICPLTKNGKYCGRRVGVLFSIGKWFGCRHCGDIAYNSQMRGGRYRGSSVCIPDIEKAEQEVKRYYYRGKPTQKYRRVMRLNEKFEHGFVIMASRFDKGLARRLAGFKK